ncbi:MAG: polyprenyl synthetase family protein [Nitrososphaerota archaeon]|nr:polyprenyl synthetase family protein [Nitrososphaerota archaeon]MDG6973502.1 polyprenyl synthetase family protein [Nitrososphaerota archaeon]MDG6975070.1 polyprenyl synthetase family protein [Nitrososphaerota archaeon]MDG7009830.1 polyprenyl synthetase family protein [Nitrososphaerota archaeon]MDG7027601.1 polyprenyl synthetase family protein [Nitrososphaerota archaeon]
MGRGGDDGAVTLEALEARMQSYAKRVDLALERELKLYAHSRFHDPLVYSIEGGKRVRPVMLMLSAEALGCKDDSVLGAAMAVELLHTESIIHDDVIDEEKVRRAKMPFHLKYGYSASLLSADFVFAMILAIAARYEDSRVAEELSYAALQMSEGEYSELTIDPQIYKLTWDEYIRIVTEKTAALFETSSKLGALIAGGGEKEVQALAEYGRCIGVAYQLKDDLLDWRSKDKVSLGLLKTHSESEVVGKMTAQAQSFAEEAKRMLMHLPRNEATVLLEDLSDFSILREY